MKCLIVDDEIEPLRALAKHIRSADCEVEVIPVTAFDTLAGLAELVRSADPEMIFMDWSIHEDFTGEDVLRSVGGRFCVPGNPDVVSTSSVDKGGMPNVAGTHYRDKHKLLYDDGIAIQKLVGLVEALRKVA